MKYTYSLASIKSDLKNYQDRLVDIEDLIAHKKDIPLYKQYLKELINSMNKTLNNFDRIGK